MKTIIIAAFCILSVLGILPSAYGSQPDVPDKIRITDSLGREIVLAKPAKTFIGIMPSTCEFLEILGKEDGIIARDSYTTDTVFFPGINQLPIINSEGSGSILDYEKIITLNPDLFIIMKNPVFDPSDAIAKLHPAIPVVVLETDNVCTMGENIRKLGRLVGEEEKAERFAIFNDKIHTMILHRLAGITESEKIPFFFKINGWTKEQLCTMTNKSTMIKTQIVDAGGKNVAGGLSGVWIQDLDREWLLTQNYDAIISMIWEKLYPGSFGYQVKYSARAASLAAEIAGMNIFSGSNAVKRKQVFLFDSRISTSPRSIITMAYMAKWLHPELFQDMDPKALHQQYLDDFLHVDIDLRHQGVLYYPDFQSASQ